MLNTLRNAWKVVEIRKKLIFTFLMLVVIRFGSELPIPGVNQEYVEAFFQNFGGGTFGFIDSLTGGSLTSMSVFALSITPYITSSIIMQLLTIAIPKLEEMQREGEDGRKKIAEYTRYLTVALALIESSAMSIGFGRQGLLHEYTAWNVIQAVATMTAGSAFLMWIGERITEKGVGNGISMVLLFNIISSIPQDIYSLYVNFISGNVIAISVLNTVIIIAVCLALVIFVVYLQDGERRIPVQYSKKMVGRKMVGGQSSHIPLKVNTAGVIPVIFASSIMSFPVVITQFITENPPGVAGHILKVLNSSYWFKVDEPIYTIGALIHMVLIVLFAYFYTSITFNPLEVANNMKKSGGFIPGIRPGKPTSDYLSKILSYIIFVGAAALIVISSIPLVISGVFSINRLSFLGTSLIIIVSVILETIKSIESQLVVRNYKGFLND